MFKAVLFVVILFFSANTLAFNPPPLPKGTYIVDLSKKLSPLEKDKINAGLASYLYGGRHPYAVLITPSLQRDDDDVEDIANKTFSSWGLPKKNGAILVIEELNPSGGRWIGYFNNVEKGINIKIGRQIIKTILDPALDNKNYAQGILDTFKKFNSLLTKNFRIQQP